MGGRLPTIGNINRTRGCILREYDCTTPRPSNQAEGGDRSEEVDRTSRLRACSCLLACLLCVGRSCGFKKVGLVLRCVACTVMCSWIRLFSSCIHRSTYLWSCVTRAARRCTVKPYGSIVPTQVRSVLRDRLTDRVRRACAAVGWRGSCMPLAGRTNRSV